MTDDATTVGARLRLLRQQIGEPRQQDIADAVGVSIRSYNNWEGDRARPTYDNALALASHFDDRVEDMTVTPEWILFGASHTYDERLGGIEAKLDQLLSTVKQLAGGASPWMTAEETAAYLRCPVSRVRKLTMTGELPHQHDGRRVLYHRARLDEYVLAGGAISP